LRENLQQIFLINREVLNNEWGHKLGGYHLIKIPPDIKYLFLVTANKLNNNNTYESHFARTIGWLAIKKMFCCGN
jgi:hypothetical protein